MYTERCKTLMTETKEDINKWKDTQYSLTRKHENALATQPNQRIQYNPVKKHWQCFFLNQNRKKKISKILCNHKIPWIV